MLTDQTWMMWLMFNTVCAALLIADLTLFHRQARTMKMSEALGWVAFWVMLAVAFNILVYLLYDKGWFGFGVLPEHALPAKTAALQFLTGYLIELSLSVDNLFVFIALFKYFHVRGEHQHRVLFWGIFGAVVMRATMIIAGVKLLQEFHWIMYLFGAILIFSGVKMAKESGHDKISPDQLWIIRVARRYLRVSDIDHHGRMFLRQHGKLYATTLFLVLLAVEATDLVFAVDSIPAILAITNDTFIAYTSNIMAILGLRAMYFALAGVMGLFAYLHYGLAGVLMFVGTKMLLPLVGVDKISTGLSLTVVASLLIVSIAASLLFAPKKS